MRRYLQKLLTAAAGLLLCAGFLLPETAMAADVAVNETNFPDAVFRSYVSQEIDKNGNGKLSQTEIADADVVDVSNKGIGSLKGVEYLTAIKGLYCGGNHLTELDVSKLTELMILYCEDNQLTSLSLLNNTKLYRLWCTGNSLTYVFIDSCADLLETHLKGEKTVQANGDTEWTYKIYARSCLLRISSGVSVYRGTPITAGNFGCEAFASYVKSSFDTDKDNCLSTVEALEVTKIDVRQMGLTAINVNPFRNLQELKAGINQLTELNVRNNPELTILECGSNKLTELTVSANRKLEHLDCSLNQLTELGLAGNTKLKYLNCLRNGIASLDLSANTALTFVNCEKNQLTQLNVTKLKELRELFCDRNSIKKLELNNPYLLTLYCYDNPFGTMPLYLTKLRTPLLYRVCLYGTVTTKDNYAEFKDEKTGWSIRVPLELYNKGNVKVATLGASCFPDAAFLQIVKDMDGVASNGLSVNKAREVNKIEIKNNEGLAGIEGIDVFPNLEELWITDCPNLTEADLSSLKHLKKATISRNAALAGLVVEGCGELEKLSANQNALTSVAVYTNVNLETLSLTSNKLTGTVNVSKNTKLTSLSVANNSGINKLDVSGLTALKSLEVWKTGISTLDVSQNTALAGLYVYSTKLQELDIGANPALTVLSCYDNEVAELDLCKTPYLARAYNLRVSNPTVLTDPDRKQYTVNKSPDGVYPAAQLTVGPDVQVVVVETQPKLISQSALNLTRKEGEEASWAFKFEGGGLSYQIWYAKPGSDSWKKATEGNPTQYNYKFTASAEYDGCRFKCVAQNGAGSAESGIATLKVIYKPVITQAPKGVTAEAGGDAVFTVKAKGNDLTYQWYWRTAAGAEAGEVKDNASAKTAKLTVEAAKSLNGVSYCCEVRNAAGKTRTGWVTLKVGTEPPAGGLPFTDVPASAPYYEALVWAYGNGIVKGTDDTHFTPNKGTTRGEFCTMLWRLNGKPALTEEMKANNPFTDIKPGKGHGTAVLWCADRGIITGYKAADGTRYFNPGGRITRTNMIVMMYKMAKNDYGAEAVKVGYSGSPYKDIKATNKNLVAYKWAYVKKISRPSNGMFEPSSKCLRWHLVFFLYRYNNVYHVK